MSAAAPAANGQQQQQDDYRRVKFNGWGSRTREMTLDTTDPSVVIHPTGKKIFGLSDFLSQEILGQGSGERYQFKPSPTISIEEALQKLPAPIVNEDFLKSLGTCLRANQILQDGESRLTHLVGKNYRDLWRMCKGIIDRPPDAVVLPESHADCVAIMDAANKYNVVVIAFGGGTNVTGGVEPSPFETRRMIISVDMRRMTKMLSIDKESQTAVFECGVLGPDLDEQLGRHGFLLGHDPDSYIHSTLGGWIAARGSGAYSNKYGDIEDMVIALKIATPKGVIETPLASRQCGPDLAPMFIGSEGIFGIITEATVKIEAIPPVRHYEGWLFPTFEVGFATFYKCTRQGLNPVCMRLYDEDDTKMSFALKTEQPKMQELMGKGVKRYLQLVKGWDLSKICLCIVGFEGTASNVAHERASITRIYNSVSAFRVGTGAGDNWQEKKYDLPYVRDFALRNGFWADVFETTAFYGQSIGLWRAVKKAVRDVWKEEGKQGWIGCHSAHQYKHGCCLYFTYAGQQFDDADLKTFLKIKRAATEAMIRYKGNLSHHHGIGYEHVPWMARHYGPLALSVLQRVKQELDPQDICNPGKVIPPPRKSRESDEAYASRSSKIELFDKMGLPGLPAVSKL